MPPGQRATAGPWWRSIGEAARPNSPATFIIAVFLAVVAVGTVALLVPLARAGQGRASLWEALFTAVSAISVTGLTLRDTATFWTPLGQVVILVLIQIGGLGIMTSTALLGLTTLRRFGLATTLSAVAETRSIGVGVGVSDVRAILARVALISAAVEVAVAAVLTVRFVVGYDEPVGRAVWLGVFHAVSAFNSAGFTLYSDSLARFGGDPWVLGPFIVAVLLGSLGFPVLLELWRNLHRRRRRWSLNSLLVLASSAVLLPFGVVAILVLEWRNPATFGSLSVLQTLGTGLFEAVVPRSAGFATIDVALMTPATLLVLDILMFVGSGPAGTGGGIKLTTATVLWFVILAEARGDEDVIAFGRRVPRGVVRQAVSVALLATGLVAGSTLLLTVISGAAVDRALFEVVSAFSTTGLSTGLTVELPFAGQALLVLLMLIGRLGPITLATALALRRRSRLYRMPEERPIIG